MPYQRNRTFPELFKPGDGAVWWAFIPNPAGGRRLRESTGHTDERAAHAWYLRRIREAARDTGKDASTLRQALGRRLAERLAAGRRPGTLDCLTKKSRQLERLLGHDTPLASIGPRTVDEYIATRLREGMARTTIQKELVMLRGAMKLARRQGYDVRPVEEVMPLDFSAGYKPRERALSMLEIEQLLEALPAKRAAVVAFLLATGATYPSEVEPLRKGDVDLAKWLVRLRGTKRATRDRKVPIVDFCRPWLERAAPYLPFESWSNVRRDMHAACAAAGIAPCSPNDLRRSVATQLRARGVEPQLIGAYLGHADSRMAERVYGRLTPDQLAHLLEQRLAATAKKKRAG